AAFWGFASVAGQSETRRVDARLQAGLRTALAGYQERVDAAQSSAATLARNRPFQIELEHNDFPGLSRMLRDSANLYVVAAGATARSWLPRSRPACTSRCSARSR